METTLKTRSYLNKSCIGAKNNKTDKAQTPNCHIFLLTFIETPIILKARGTRFACKQVTVSTTALHCGISTKANHHVEGLEHQVDKDWTIH